MAADAVMQQKNNLWRMNGHVESSKEREREVVWCAVLRTSRKIPTSVRAERLRTCLLVCCTG